MSISIPTHLDRAGFLGIAEALRRAITAGALEPEVQLPPISELAQRYRTTPVTVRRALRHLEEQGLVRVEHGVGTFVTDWAAQYDLLQLPSFSDEMAARQLRSETRVRKRQTQVLREEAAAALELSPGSELALLARLRCVEGAPVAYQRSYLPPALRDLVAQLDEGQSLYQRLQVTAGRAPLTADERLTAIVLPPDLCAELTVAPGSAGWRAARLTRDAEGRPLIWDEAYFAGERIALRLNRRAAQTTLEYELIVPAATGGIRKKEE